MSRWNRLFVICSAVLVMDTTSATTLIFSGETLFSTEPVRKVSPTNMYDFFQLDEHRNFLVSGGGKHKVEHVKTTPELLERWNEEATRMGAKRPSKQDAILQVVTGGMKFPGIKVTSIILVGSKLLKTSSSSSYPEYQFTLISDQRQVKGAPPMVWIYNQLTGSGKKKGDASSSSSSVHSLSRVTIVQIGDNLAEFSNAANLEISMSFPSLLLRLLPTSKERVEKQGSASILKTLTKETEASLKVFRAHYLKWIEEAGL